MSETKDTAAGRADESPIPSHEPEDHDPREMSFLDHLEELRGVLFRCLVAFTFGILIVIFFIGQVADLLSWPLDRAYAAVGMTDENLITTRVFEIFTVLITVCFLSGFVISLPFMLYFGAQFVAPGLTKKELSILRPGCVAAFLLFLTGASFAFFMVLPKAIEITLRLNRLFNIEQYLTVGSYYATVVWVTFAVGVAFEFPLIIILLAYIDIVTVKQLLESRRMAFVFTLIASALITPGGDPITLMILALPLYGLYEAAIVISEKLIRKRPSLEDAVDAA